jgi:hypothetical protein
MVVVNNIFHGLWFLFVVLCCSTGSEGRAGPIDELVRQHPCIVNGSPVRISLEKGEGIYSVSASQQFVVGTIFRPVLIINQSVAYEQPAIVLAFEYYAACEEAGEARSGAYQPTQPESKQFVWDCRAVARMQRDGYLLSRDEINAIVDNFKFRRVQTFAVASFARRAANLQACIASN